MNSHLSGKERWAEQHKLPVKTKQSKIFCQQDSFSRRKWKKRRSNNDAVMVSIVKHRLVYYLVEFYNWQLICTLYFLRWLKIAQAKNKSCLVILHWFSRFLISDKPQYSLISNYLVYQVSKHFGYDVYRVGHNLNWSHYELYRRLHGWTNYELDIIWALNFKMSNFFHIVQVISF